MKVWSYKEHAIQLLQCRNIHVKISSLSGYHNLAWTEVCSVQTSKMREREREEDGEREGEIDLHGATIFSLLFRRNKFNNMISDR